MYPNDFRINRKPSYCSLRSRKKISDSQPRIDANWLKRPQRKHSDRHNVFLKSMANTLMNWALIAMNLVLKFFSWNFLSNDAKFTHRKLLEVVKNRSHQLIHYGLLVKINCQTGKKREEKEKQSRGACSIDSNNNIPSCVSVFFFFFCFVF